jgi:hypothetical protein
MRGVAIPSIGALLMRGLVAQGNRLINFEWLILVGDEYFLDIDLGMSWSLLNI